MNVYEALDFIRDKTKKKKVIIDTDTCNEVDDQFAIAYSIACPDIDVLSINAAPFFNGNSTSFENGMEKSYAEIKRVLKAYKDGDSIPVYEGARNVIEANEGKAVDSPAARNIIKAAKESDEPVVIFGIGACTNISSALLLAPEIKENLIVIWLGGNSIDGDNLGEFNLVQDYTGGQVLLDSGVPLVLCPAWCVTCVLYTLLGEFEKELSNGDPMCTLLWQLINEYYHGAECPAGYGRTIWDIGAPAIIACPECADLKIITAPIFSDERIYNFDDSRHKIIYLEKIDRDKVYADLWKTLQGFDFGGEYVPRWQEEKE